ncbi:Mariner Mos1 transposase [Eumeta japonica]|uniref:Mariner Mos1 transposase n=1 Tax=Eumeta variegata TaxID=151549 RepID=A0A4C1V2D3_EUMVA|nr:Mariner Mos1 transposase [Eumeta japonica]
MSQKHKILHEHLAVRKLCTRWIPHNLTEGQKLRRVNWCRDMMQRFGGGDSNVVYNMVTGDESWIYCNDPETKRQSAQWVFPFEELPTKVKRDRTIVCLWFWKKFGNNDLAVEFSFIMTTPHQIPPDKQLTI